MGEPKLIKDRYDCPNCPKKGFRGRPKLHFKCIGGMRVTRVAAGRAVATALCPECGESFYVDTGKADS